MAFGNTKQDLVNPVTQFIDWQGKDSKGFFTFWDKDEKKNETIELSKFAIIDVGNTVKGYYQANESGIYSNEIKNMNQTLRVMTSKKGEPTMVLAEGYWTDRKNKKGELVAKGIKEEVKGLGGNLYLGITMLDLKDNIMKEFYIKGQAFYDFSQLLKQVGAVKGNASIVKFDGAKLVEGKAFNYNEPEFSITKDQITDKQQAILETYAEEVDDYYAALREKYKADKENEPEDSEEVKYAPEPTGIQSDEDFEAEVKAENKAKKSTVNTDDKGEEISVEEIPF